MSDSNVIIQDSNKLEASYSQKIDNLEQEVSRILELDELDAYIYLNLLRIGPVTASTLAKELNIERTKAYRTVDKLLGLRIVSTTFSKPKLCIANKPDEVINSLLKQKETQISRMRKTKKYIVKRIEETIPTNYTSNLPTFNIAQGTDKIFSDIEKLIENAEGVVYIVTTLRDLSKMYHTNIPEKIQACKNNGIEVRLVTEKPNDKFLPFVRKLNATKTRFGKLSSRGRMVVEKDRQMIMSDVVWGDSDQTDVESDCGVCTNSTEMVNNIFTLCDFLWTSFRPLKTVNVQV
jgi:HTH-type transcriptional regulator, sugar sensing transcriptional regulator